MKIKKGLALILALAMIITLMPTMAFASTTNTVDKTYSVAADEDMPTTLTSRLQVQTALQLVKKTNSSLHLKMQNGMQPLQMK